MFHGICEKRDNYPRPKALMGMSACMYQIIRILQGMGTCLSTALLWNSSLEEFFSVKNLCIT